MDRRTFVEWLCSTLGAGWMACRPDDVGTGGGETRRRASDLDLDLPEHARWLYDPADVAVGGDDDWFGYILTRPKGAPDEHPLGRLYSEFGIEMNLKHYGLDYGMMGLEEMDYSSVDVTRYAPGTDLENPSSGTTEDLKTRLAVRLDRPASTGGPLSGQDVVDQVEGFDVYERGAALNQEERVLVSGPQEYFREEVVPAIIRTEADDLPADLVSGAYEEVWRRMNPGHYNEVGLEPAALPTYSSDYPELRAFARSESLVSAGEVEVTQVEVYPRDVDVDPDSVLGKLKPEDLESTDVDGDVVVHRARTEELVTAYSI